MTVMKVGHTRLERLIVKVHQLVRTIYGLSALDDLLILNIGLLDI
jgi:hypothetical protein